MTARLLDERVVAVNPSLVAAFGSAALVLQQVHYHALHDAPELEWGDHLWWRLDLEQYGTETGLSVHQVRRAITKLEREEVLVAVAPGGYDRTKYHRIDHAHAAFGSDCPSRDIANSISRERDHEHAESQTPLTKNLHISRADQRMPDGRPIGPQELRDVACEACEGSGVTPFGAVCECFHRRSRGAA